VCLTGVGMPDGRNADRLDWQPCYAAKWWLAVWLGSALRPYTAVFRWSAFHPVGIKAVTDCTRECWQGARSFSFGRFSSADRPGLATLACVLYHRPKRSDRSGRSPTLEPGRFATPTSRAFYICVNGASGGDV